MAFDKHRAVGSVWRHRRTGHVYAIVGVCRLEHSAAPAYLYCRPEDGIVWARDMDEFLDGRFEPVDSARVTSLNTAYRQILEAHHMLPDDAAICGDGT